MHVCVSAGAAYLQKLLHAVLPAVTSCQVVLVADEYYQEQHRRQHRRQQQQQQQQRQQQQQQRDVGDVGDVGDGGGGFQFVPAPGILVISPIDGGCRHGWDE